MRDLYDLTPIASADGLTRFMVDFADDAPSRFRAAEAADFLAAQEDAPVALPQADGEPNYRPGWHRYLATPDDC